MFAINTWAYNYGIGKSRSNGKFQYLLSNLWLGKKDLHGTNTLACSSLRSILANYMFAAYYYGIGKSHFKGKFKTLLSKFEMLV